MMDYIKTLEAIDGLIPLLQEDIVTNGNDEFSGSFKELNLDKMGSKAEKKACYDYLSKLDPDVLLGVETAMYVGREIYQGSTFSTGQVRNLDDMRKMIVGKNDEHCAEQICGKMSSVLLKYFAAYKDVAI